MFPPILIRLCVCLLHKQHTHGWHVLATVDYQDMRISISWVAQSWLTCSGHFWLSAGAYFQFMSSTIIDDIFPLLWLSESAYSHFISSIIIADMFPSLLTLSECVIISFHELRHHGWHVPFIFDSQAVRSSISYPTPSKLTCSHHFRLMQDNPTHVRNFISFSTPVTSRLTCSCHFRLM